MITEVRFARSVRSTYSCAVLVISIVLAPHVHEGLVFEEHILRGPGGVAEVDDVELFAQLLHGVLSPSDGRYGLGIKLKIK